MVHLKIENKPRKLHKKEKSILCNVLLIESDYVNFLLSGEMLREINVSFQRVNSFHEATLIDNIANENIDLVLISDTEFLSTNHSAVSYLKSVLKTPVLLLLNQQSDHKQFGEYYNYFDGVILNNADPQYFREIILDMLQVKKV